MGGGKGQEGGVHVLGKDAVAAGRVVDKHMGYCADQHPVLENRGAGHPLHNAAGQLQQLGVGDVQDHVFGGLVLAQGDLLDDGIEKAGFFSGDGGENFDRAGVNLVAVCHGNGLGVGGRLIQPAVHAVIAVGVQPAGGVSGDKGALQLAGISGGSGLDADDGGFHDFSLRQGHQLAGIDITDCVSESGKIPISRVIEGHGSNAGGAVPHPQSQVVVVVQRGENRGKGKLLQVAAAAHRQGERLSARGVNQLGQLFFGGDFFSVQAEDNIPFPNTGIAGRIDRLAVEIGDCSGSDDHHAVGHHLDAEGGSAQGNLPAVHDLHADILDFDETEKAQIHLEGIACGGVDRNRVGAAAGFGLDDAVLAERKVASLCQKVAVRQQGRQAERSAKSQQNQNGKDCRSGAVGAKQNLSGGGMC